MTLRRTTDAAWAVAGIRYPRNLCRPSRGYGIPASSVGSTGDTVSPLPLPAQPGIRYPRNLCRPDRGYGIPAPSAGLAGDTVSPQHPSARPGVLHPSRGTRAPLERVNHTHQASNRRALGGALRIAACAVTRAGCGRKFNTTNRKVAMTKLWSK